MSFTREQRAARRGLADLTPQELTLLGALEAMPDSTAGELAEAMTEAQPLLVRFERVPTPVSGHTVGQWLGRLLDSGYVRSDPPRGTPGRRRWSLA